jgi:hypothetical protein
MSTVTPTTNGRVRTGAPAVPLSAPGRMSVVALAGRFALARAFAQTVLGYLLLVLPLARRELSHWQQLAAAIPDPALAETPSRP